MLPCHTQITHTNQLSGKMLRLTAQSVCARVSQRARQYAVAARAADAPKAESAATPAKPKADKITKTELASRGAPLKAGGITATHPTAPRQPQGPGIGAAAPL
jgi:hypothetical protein